jgi:hypothetical protein
MPSDYDTPRRTESEDPVQVVPQQADQFTCLSCFLVHDRGRLVSAADGRALCRDCA